MAPAEEAAPAAGAVPAPGDVPAAGAAARAGTAPVDVASGAPPWRRRLRYWIVRIAIGAVMRILFRLEVDGRSRLARGPALYCFNHLSWSDPFVLGAVLPMRPRLFFFGPREEDMRAGARNRLMSWSGMAVPFRPGKEDLLRTTRRVRRVFDGGGVVAIAGEGAIHVHEGDLLPLQEGTAYFALRSGVPIIPVAISGTSWLRFRGRIRVRVGEPMDADGRPSRVAVDELTTRAWRRLRSMVADDVDLPVPGPFGRWLTDLFNDWGPGGRAAAEGVHGPEPEAPATPSGILPPEPARETGSEPDGEIVER